MKKNLLISSQEKEQKEGQLKGPLSHIKQAFLRSSKKLSESYFSDKGH